MSVADRPSRERRARARAALARLRPGLADRAAAALGEAEADALLARLDKVFGDAYEPLETLYGDAHDVEALVGGLLDTVLDAAAARPADLRALDRRREIDPDWFQRPDVIGYVCYVDRFSETLPRLTDHVDHLVDLGVRYLHLMPLLAPRPDPNDGGYAVADYRAVDPRLGTMDDLSTVAATLRANRISLCVDLVVNHTAREHEWAQRAMAGDPDHRAFYHVFDDREMPDAYEATLPDVFPATAPGSFTFVPELDGWVWTTFHDYQWDLDYGNPGVLGAMLEVMLHLANQGVEVLRLDAVPFLWKRMGTNCQNQPEVHDLLQVFRALVRVAAPAVLFKAEAIVPPGELVGYLGTHDRHRPECDLAYHNQLMVMAWSALAERDARLATHALARMKTPPPTTAWCTYVRCHDDIGWAVDDVDAGAVGLGGASHRRFLADFYAGDFPGSFARGARFQADPSTGDARTSGSAASLCGLEAALEREDPEAVELAVRRLLLLHAIALSYGGVPLLYMGDEIGLRSDAAYADDPAHADDNRWLHRPRMDWRAAARRHDPATVEGRVFTALRALVEARREIPALHAGGRVEPIWTDDTRVLAYRRTHPRFGHFLGLANMSESAASVPVGLLGQAGLRHPFDALDDADGGGVVGDRILLPPLGTRWFTDE